MTILSSKPNVKFGGKTYKVGEPIPFSVIGKNVQALRSAGIVRTADLTEREAYTSGERFKRYSPPLFASFVVSSSTVSGSLALSVALESEVENQSELAGHTGLAMPIEGDVDGSSSVGGEVDVVE